jgi:hypothetical protein
MNFRLLRFILSAETPTILFVILYFYFRPARVCLAKQAGNYGAGLCGSHSRVNRQKKVEYMQSQIFNNNTNLSVNGSNGVDNFLRSFCRHALVSLDLLVLLGQAKSTILGPGSL